MGCLALGLLIIAVPIVAIGLFSGTEIAIILAKRHRLEQLARQGRCSAHAALSLAEHPNQFLFTVQIGITLTSLL